MAFGSSFRAHPVLLTSSLVLALGLAASVQADDTAATASAPPAAAAPAVVRTFAIDPVHSSVGFSIRHLVSHVKGSFSDFSGDITANPSDIGATRGEVVIKVDSIDTNNEKRDGHLKSPDFFEVEKNPEIRFKITGVKPTGPNTAIARGDFTLKGVTKPIELLITDITFGDFQGKQLLGFTANTTINRDDFGITWNKVLDAGGLALGKDVDITIAIESGAQLAPAPAPKPAAGM